MGSNWTKMEIYVKKTLMYCLSTISKSKYLYSGCNSHNPCLRNVRITMFSGTPEHFFFGKTIPDTDGSVIVNAYNVTGERFFYIFSILSEKHNGIV